MLLRRPRLFVAFALLALAVLTGAGLSMRAPEHVSANPLGGFSEVSGGLYHSCGLMTDSSVKCWGGIGFEGVVPGDVAGLSPASDIANGKYHACVVTPSGSVKCFGSNYGTIPVTVAAFGSNNVSISAGWDYTCAVKTSGGIECFFTDGTPLAATGLTSGIAQVAASNGFHTCVVMTSGTIKCWGFNDFGQVGDGTTTPRPTAVTVSGITNATQVGLGTFYSCALTAAGGVKCWGDGFGLTPVDVPGMTSGIVQIAVNVQHFCALTSGGGVKCRGANQWGQLGDNQVCGTFCTAAVNVDGLASGVSSIGTGVSHSCAVLTTGTAKCWGFNASANLGIGVLTRQSNIPLDVVVANVKPAPTATACPMTCPTATPTPFVDRSGLNFSLGIDANGDKVDDCKSVAPGPATCNLQVGAPFNLRVYLKSLPPDLPGGVYDGMDIIIQHSGGADPKNNTTWLWPDCIDPASAYGIPGFIAIACGTFGGSVFTGVLARTVFTCSGAGTLALDHGNGVTGLYAQGYFYETQGLSDQLTINCVNLPPTATFTQGPPPSTPTPGPVGGQAFDPSPGSGSASAAGLLLVLGSGAFIVMLVGTLFARTRLRK